MTILHREVEWLQGIDPRAIGRTEWELGYIRVSDWSHPSAPGFSRYTNTPGIVGSHWRPFLTQLVPFGADAAGVTFDTDQLYACFYGGAGSGSPVIYADGRTPGDTRNPLTFDYPYLVPTTDQSKRESWVVYRASNVPAGASVTFKFYNSLGNPTLANYTIASAAYTRNLCQYLPAQTIDYGNDPNPYMVVTWSGGVPLWEDVRLSIFCAAAHYVPVPATLDAAYTARTAHDVERGGIFADRQHADRRRTRATPQPWEPSIPSGLAAFDQSEFWLSGVLKSNSWLPVGINGQIYRLSAGVPSWPNDGRPPYSLTDPQVVSSSYVGMRSILLDINYTHVTGLAAFKVEVLVDGVIQSTGTYSSSSTGNVVSVPALPTPGTMQTVTLKVYAPTGMSGHWDDALTASLRMSPRIDIPYPFPVVGREQTGARLTAPGGYLPSALTDYVPSGANVSRLAAGVTSATAKSSFKPGADAWYQTKNGGGTLISGGSDDFGAADLRQIDRGRTSQPYYIAGAGNLSVYTPSPHAIASGGTDLTPTVGNWWEWGTIAFGGAGSWLVSVLCKNKEMLKRGIVAEWSATESTVIHPDGQAIFETLDEGASLGATIVWAGSGTTPPGSPVIGDAWVILATATGAWTGHEGQWALWDGIVADWIFFTPDRGSYLINAAGTDWTWFDGVTWKAKTDPVMTIPVTTSGALTWGLSLRQFSLERAVTTDPNATVKWAAA